MTSSKTELLSKILRDVREDVTGAKDQLMDAVYSELRAMAAHKMAGERAEHTLQPTALVNEAWFRLFDGSSDKWGERGYFFTAAAEAMRRVLIDHARARNAAKRGGDFTRIELDDNLAVSDPELLAVDVALQRLEKEDQRFADVVKLRYFAGLSVKETAKVLDVAPRTINNDWRYAKAWLKREIAGVDLDGESVG